MPKRVVTEQWMCFDGVPKPTEAEANAYEKRIAHVRLVGLTIEQVEAALSRADPELADAIEVIGSRIERARLAAGERKHERKHERKANGAPSPRPDPDIGTGPGSADEGDADVGATS